MIEAQKKLPRDLKDVVDKVDEVDFIVKTKRFEKKTNGIIFMLISFFALGLNYYVFITQGESIMSEIPSKERIEIFIYMCVIAVFLFGYGIYRILKTGFYFIVTPEKLIRYRNNSIELMYWSEFLNEVKIEKKGLGGDIILFNQKIMTKDTSKSKTQGIIYMGGVENFTEVGEKCKLYIQQFYK